MFSWFRSGLPPHQTALAMIGAKTGQTVLFLGGRQPGVVAEIARVTGLNGRTVVVESDPSLCGRVEAAAAEAGTLVEFVATAPAGSINGERLRDKASPALIAASRAVIRRPSRRVRAPHSRRSLRRRRRTL